MKPGGDQWQVDDALLTETGRGGLFTDGYLEGAPLVSYLEDGETPLFVFGSGNRGLRKEREGETERIVPGSGFRAITAVTDRRVQFVVGGGHEDGDWAESVRLSEIDRVTVDSGLIRKQLSIDARDGVSYHVYLKDVDTERLVTYLEDVSWAWIQVEQLLDEARKHLVDAGQREKSRAYDESKAAITRTRRTLDEAETVTEDLSPEASTGIHERIDQVERRYRETKRRVHASRATHLVDEAERNWREDRFDRAYEQFCGAREEYRTILDIDGLDPEKADAMRKRIANVDGNLDHLSKAPLRRAGEACRRAREASTNAEAIDHWEQSLELYRRVIELDWGRDRKRFEGDVDLVRDRVVDVVEEILSTRRALVDERVDRAEQLLDAEAYSGARSAYADAVDHLEAAIETAREFDPDAVADLQDRLVTLEAQIRTAMTTVAGATDESTTSGGETAASGPVGDGDSDATRTDHEGTDYDDFDNWVTLTGDDEETDATSQPTGVDPIDPSEAHPDAEESLLDDAGDLLPGEPETGS